MLVPVKPKQKGQRRPVLCSGTRRYLGAEPGAEITWHKVEQRRHMTFNPARNGRNSKIRGKGDGTAAGHLSMKSRW